MNYIVKKVVICITVFILACYLIILSSCTGRDMERHKDDVSERMAEEIMQQVSFQNVKITDNFWKPRIEKSRTLGIRSVFEACSYSLDNFDIAAGKKEGEHKGTAASDSDVYKIIQGVAYALHHYPDRELEVFVDSLIDRIVAAQQPDGYLYTYWTINDPEMKFKDIERKHELYCAGHMFKAAAAYYQVTGKRKMLNAAIRLADHIDSVFGPDKRVAVPGHEEIELALYKLYKATGEKRYLDLSMFFIDERGNPERIADDLVPPEHDPNANKPSRWRHPSYRQDHLPVEEQYYAIGHAVRAAYLYSGMADIAMETGSYKYVPALDSIWNDIVLKKLYITGSIGTRQFHDEGFGTAYLLPNDKAYCETCSGIALTFWNRRMNLLHSDAKYADMLELTMYNAGISGVSLDGDRFFYTNPLESVGKNRRRPWFEPGCCPSNMVRFLPEIGSNIYGKKDSEIYINQFIANEANIELKEGKVNIIQITNYPWEGEIKIVVNLVTTANFKLNIRIPGWATGNLLPGNLYSYLDDDEDPCKEIVLKINGKRIDKPGLVKGYAVIDRNWEKGDVIELSLPMDVQFVTGNPKIEDTFEKVVLTRGPIVYCVEEVDNKRYFDDDNEAFLLPAGIKAEFRKDLLEGVVVLKGYASLLTIEEEIDVTAIPYYAWCNRAKGHMKVWLPVYMQ